VPSNSVLCVVGNNDFDEVVRIAEQFEFGVRSSEFGVVEVPEIKKKIVKNSEKRAGVEQTNLVLGFHFPYAGEDGRYVAELFSTILGEGMSSKLFTEVREKRGLVYSVKTDLDLGKNYGYMIIWAGTDEGKRQEVIDICLEEFKKMGKISEKELAEAKIQVVGSRRVEMEGSNETAVNLIMEEISGDAEDYYDYEKKVGAVSLKEIRKLAKIVDYSSFSLGP